MSVSLHKKLTLMERRRVADTMGGYRTDWTALGQVWAHLEVKTPTSSGAGTQERRSRGVAVMRAGAPDQSSYPKAGQRLAYAGRHFSILSVQIHPEERGYLRCDIEEVAAP